MSVNSERSIKSIKTFTVYLSDDCSIQKSFVWDDEAVIENELLKICNNRGWCLEHYQIRDLDDNLVDINLKLKDYGKESIVMKNLQEQMINKRKSLLKKTGTLKTELVKEVANNDPNIVPEQILESKKVHENEVILEREKDIKPVELILNGCISRILKIQNENANSLFNIFTLPKKSSKGINDISLNHIEEMNQEELGRILINYFLFIETPIFQHMYPLLLESDEIENLEWRNSIWQNILRQTPPSTRVVLQHFLEQFNNLFLLSKFETEQIKYTTNLFGNLFFVQSLREQVISSKLIKKEKGSSSPVLPHRSSGSNPNITTPPLSTRHKQTNFSFSLDLSTVNSVPYGTPRQLTTSTQRRRSGLANSLSSESISTPKASTPTISNSSSSLSSNSTVINTSLSVDSLEVRRKRAVSSESPFSSDGSLSNRSDKKINRDSSQKTRISRVLKDSPGNTPILFHIDKEKDREVQARKVLSEKKSLTTITKSISQESVPQTNEVQSFSSLSPKYYDSSSPTPPSTPRSPREKPAKSPRAILSRSFSNLANSSSPTLSRRENSKQQNIESQTTGETDTSENSEQSSHSTSSKLQNLISSTSLKYERKKSVGAQSRKSDSRNDTKLDSNRDTNIFIFDQAHAVCGKIFQYLCTDCSTLFNDSQLESDNSNKKFNKNDAGFFTLSLATIDQIIWHLFQADYFYIDNYYFESILTLFSYFSPKENNDGTYFLQQIIEQYKLICSPEYSDGPWKPWLRQRTLQIIIRLVEIHPFLLNGTNFSNIVIDFLKLVSGECWRPIEKKLISNLENCVNNKEMNGKTQQTLTNAQTLFKKNPKFDPTTVISNPHDISDSKILMNIVEQFALLHNSILNIKIEELVSFMTTEKSPTIEILTQHYNEIVGWVQTLILTQSEISVRRELYSSFSTMASKCIKHTRNFFAAMAIFNALESVPINRLKQTKSNLSKKTMKQIGKLEATFSYEKSYAEYRKLFNLKKVSSPEPTIPALVVITKDLFGIEEGNKNIIKQDEIDLINVQKLVMIYKTFKTGLTQPTKPYPFAKLENYQSFLTNLPFKENEELYQLSKLLEPPITSS